MPVVRVCDDCGGDLTEENVNDGMPVCSICWRKYADDEEEE